MDVLVLTLSDVSEARAVDSTSEMVFPSHVTMINGKENTLVTSLATGADVGRACMIVSVQYFP